MASRRTTVAEPPVDPMFAAAQAAVEGIEAAPVEGTVTADAVVAEPDLTSISRAITLVDKIAALALLIGDKDPSKENKAQHYKFIPATDVLGWWRVKLQANGIIIIPRVISYEVMIRKTKNDGESILTSALIEYTFRSGKGEELVIGPVLAQGDDSGDKGAGKLMTYGLKIALLQVGMNASDQDVEDDDETDQRYETRPARQRQQRQSRRSQQGSDDPYGTPYEEDPGTVVIGDSDIQGVERGGRNANATTAQVEKIRALAQRKGFGVNRMVEFASSLFNEVIDDVTTGPALVEYLDSLSAQDLGNLVVALSEEPDLDGQ